MKGDTQVSHVVPRLVGHSSTETPTVKFVTPESLSVLTGGKRSTLTGGDVDDSPVLTVGGDLDDTCSSSWHVLDPNRTNRTSLWGITIDDNIIIIK